MLNIHLHEIAQFETLASNWWDKNGPCRPLHDLNPVRLQFISQHCVLQQKRVLDIGCGGGLLTESLYQKGAIVTGIDASLQLIEIARQHAAQSFPENPAAIHYEPSTAESYAIQCAEYNVELFDIITCMELLEHVPNPTSLIQAMASLLKPNGHLFLSTLNRTAKAYALAILGAEYCLNLLPKGTHTYKQFIRPSELQQALQTAGMSLKELQGMRYNPLFKTATLSSDVSVNYLAYATKSLDDHQS